jgi:hypothetical protein
MAMNFRFTLNIWKFFRSLTTVGLSRTQLHGVNYLFSQSVSQSVHWTYWIMYLFLSWDASYTRLRWRSSSCIVRTILHNSDLGGNAFNLYSGGARFEFWPANRYPGRTVCVLVSLSIQKPELGHDCFLPYPSEFIIHHNPIIERYPVRAID